MIFLAKSERLWGNDTTFYYIINFMKDSGLLGQDWGAGVRWAAPTLTLPPPVSKLSLSSLNQFRQCAQNSKKSSWLIDRRRKSSHLFVFFFFIFFTWPVFVCTLGVVALETLDCLHSWLPVKPVFVLGGRFLFLDGKLWHATRVYFVQNYWYLLMSLFKK